MGPMGKMWDPRCPHPTPKCMDHGKQAIRDAENGEEDKSETTGQSSGDPFNADSRSSVDSSRSQQARAGGRRYTYITLTMCIDNTGEISCTWTKFEDQGKIDGESWCQGQTCTSGRIGLTTHLQTMQFRVQFREQLRHPGADLRKSPKRQLPSLP